MSESVAAPTIDLEDADGAPIQNALGTPDGQEPAAPVVPVTPPAATAAEPVAAAPVVAPVTPAEPDLEPKPTDDPAIRGLKAALASEREKNRTLKPQVEAAKFLTQHLQQHPDLAQQLDLRIRGVQPPAPAPKAPETPPASEFSEQQLRDTAQNYILFDPQKPGELDLKAAERVLKGQKQMATEIAQQIARETVKPVESHVQQTKFVTNSQRILGQAQQMGIQPETMQPLIGAIGASQPELLDDPGVGQLLMFIARGMSGAQPAAPVVPAAPVAPPAVPPREPILTEAPGGKTPTAPKPLDDLEARVARKLGLTHEKYTDTVNKMPTAGGWRHINLE
jgi:hypothetical protein